jgi:acetyltransferase-like isoleucine patch superfamily enzyme
MRQTRVKPVVKAIVNAIALALMLPFAAVSGFGRLSGVFQLFAQAVALVPGLPGDYLRVAYYVMTLRRCSLNARVSFGSFFAQSSATVSRGVYIGSYCVIGSCHIGPRTQIASLVQILSGQRQHSRDECGRILGADEESFTPVEIGADCWLGAAALVMADVGTGSTIGAGAVVTRAIPPNVVAVGNPARVVERRGADVESAPPTRDSTGAGETSAKGRVRETI